MTLRLAPHCIVALAGLALAGCASPSPMTPAASGATPAANTVPTPDVGPVAGLDGVYRAPSGGVAGSATCGTTRFGYPIRVEGGVATMQTVSSGQLQGTVAPDGSLTVAQQVATLTGKFSGGKFAGTLEVRNRSRPCVYLLEYAKR